MWPQVREVGILPKSHKEDLNPPLPLGVCCLPPGFSVSLETSAAGSRTLDFILLCERPAELSANRDYSKLSCKALLWNPSKCTAVFHIPCQRLHGFSFCDEGMSCSSRSAKRINICYLTLLSASEARTELAVSK